MSVVITGRRISGVADQRASLGNDQIVRQILTTSWNKIRVGVRMCVTVQTSITGTPKFYIGVCNNSNAAGNNGAGSRVTNHFVGMLSTTASWNFSAGPGFYTVAFTSARRINATNVTSGTGSSIITATPETARCMLAVDIDKTNPSAVAVDLVGINNTVTGTPDLSLANFIAQLKSDAIILDGYAKTSLTTSLTINEGTDGVLNSVNVSWMKTLERLEFSDVSYHIFS